MTPKKKPIKPKGKRVGIKRWTYRDVCDIIRVLRHMHNPVGTSWISPARTEKLFDRHLAELVKWRNILAPMEE